MSIKRTISHLKHLDFLGTGVNLNIAGQDRLKTYLGAFLTVCLVGSLMTVWWFQAQTYLETTSPQIFQEFSDLDDGAEIDLVEKKLLPTIGIYDEVLQNGLPAADVAKYVTIKGLMLVSKYNLATSSWDVTQTPLDPVACSTLTPEERKLYDFENFGTEKRFTGFLNDKAICLKPPSSTMKIFGSVAKSHVGVFSVQLFPCSLASGCVTALEFARVSVVLGDSKKSIRYADLSSPVTTIPNMNTLYQINQAMTQDYQSNFRLNEIYDNFGFGYSARLRTSYFDIGTTGYLTRMRNSAQITCTLPQIAASACAPYLKFSFRSSPRYSKTIRNYKGPTETLGEMGGVKEIFFVVFFLLYFPFDYFNKRYFILEKVFGIRQDIKALFSFQKTSDSNESPEDSSQNRSCCRKKHRPNSEQGCQEELQDLGSDLIERNLDVVSLVKALNDLRMLMGTFINEKQERIASYVSLRRQAYLLTKYRQPKRSTTQVLPQQEPSLQIEPILLEYSKPDTEFLDEMGSKTKHQFVDYYIRNVLDSNQTGNQNQAISMNEFPALPQTSQRQLEEPPRLEQLDRRDPERFGTPKQTDDKKLGSTVEMNEKPGTQFPLSSRPAGKGHLMKAQKFSMKR